MMKPLSVEKLYKRCKPETLKFKTTEEVQKSRNMREFMGHYVTLDIFLHIHSIGVVLNIRIT